MNVRPFDGTRSRSKPLESGKVYGPAIECRHGIDPNSVEPVGARLVERNHIGMDFHDVQEKILVAHARQARFFLGLRNARHVVDFFFLDASDVALSIGRERGLGQEFGP